MLLFCNSTIIKVHGMHNIAYILMTEDQSLVKANESHTKGKSFLLWKEDVASSARKQRGELQGRMLYLGTDWESNRKETE